MDEQRLQQLVEKFIENRISVEEEAELLELYRLSNNAELEFFDDDELTRRRMLAAINSRINPPKVRKLWPSIAAAACLLIGLSFCAYLIFRLPSDQSQAPIVLKDINPGGDKATLTLANGQEISLSKALSGQIAVQGQTHIDVQNGKVIYTGQKDDISGSNTLTTKRKEQFPLILSDGTEVMLDAASSITYPVAFNGKERRVKITGQAYFKVVHHANQPFIVEAKGQTVRDIGTEFNINAYDDEPALKTTLVEGLVSVTYGNIQKNLKPGQEANLKDKTLTINVADIDGATAWKQNLFYFSDADIKTVMRQFARWYDVDVFYEGKLTDDRFGGEMSRNVKASKVFEALNKYGYKFEIQGRKVIVRAQ